ncbi:MAG: hypothetical protein JRI43_04040, partial [Deltaproteobacteria bacterium]|nr:hypothetical protein [Deltaproteobacteria bacterium]
MTRSRVLFLFIISLLFFVGTAKAYAACPEPAIADYSALPVFLGSTVTPSILVILDNSASMNEKAYAAAYDHNTKYYGYFEPHKKYTYSSNVFYRDENGDWDGNFLNWVSMRRVDVVRKVLMGGLATARSGGGNQTNIGESPTGYSYTQYYGQIDTWDVTPNQNTYFYLFVSNGNFNYWYYDGAWHDEGLFVIKVKKGEDINGATLSDEGANFMDGNLAGIMQRLWQKARFGLEIFNDGNDDQSNQNGGLIKRVIGSSMTDMINNIQNLAADTWTPLAESYYTAIKYFMQEDMEIAMDQANNVIPNNTAAQDPYNNPDPVHCAKSFVLLLTDGASSKDLYVPDSLKDYDGDGNDGRSLVDSGTTPEGVLVATNVSDTVKTFYLNYIDGYAAGTTPYPSGTTPFTTNYIGDALVLYDSNDKQVYYGEITAVNTTYDDWDGTSGTSEITVSGTTDTPEWKSGVSPYTYDLSWKVVASTPNNEVGGSNGSDYLDDLALYARTNDLRSDLSGEQNIILYPVYAFGSDATARNLLRDAAKNGGFEDRNGNGRPDLTVEWDPDEDGEPDNYYEASDGFVLETKLIQAINDILQRAASGTAVSVLATSGEGEGNLVQAFFRTSIPSGVTEVRWLGYLQSIWVDAYGNLREDSDGDLALDVTKDKVITHFLDSSDGNAKIMRFDVSEGTPYPDVETGTFEVVEIDEIDPLWEAGSRLALRSADDRKIFTYIDKDKDGVVDEPSGDDDPFDNDGEVILFHTSGVSNIIPYLGVRDDSTWDYLGVSQSDRANNLIGYIRGKDSGFSGTTTMITRPRT